MKKAEKKAENNDHGHHDVMITLALIILIIYILNYGQLDYNHNLGFSQNLC